MQVRGTLRELLRTGPGKAGAALLAVLIILSLYSLVRYPLDFGRTRWSNPAYWADNPKAAPPSWSNWLTTKDRVRHTEVSAETPGESHAPGAGASRTYTMPLRFAYDEPPAFLLVSVRGVEFQERAPALTVALERPDGTSVTLYREALRGPREGETGPYRRFSEEPLRVALTSEQGAASAVAGLYRDEYGAELDEATLRPLVSKALFGVPDAGARDGIRLARGEYRVTLRAIFSDERDTLAGATTTMGGTAYGLMGTDSIGRDLAAGLVFGLPVALLIGVAASVITTLIGATLGVISGYVGGKTDLAIQRFADIINNVPLLPLLIFFVFIVGSNLWLIILFLVAFSWPGLTILLRSMVLQIRSGQLVEAATAMGASRWRIMARHIFPQMAPFVFAQMIFFAPAAILAEAGLSFLGLGDPSIPTWGQILESGFRTGAVYLGYWWWVIPPGVLIIITAVTFMLLSLGMEPVMNPRLRRGRS